MTKVKSFFTVIEINEPHAFAKEDLDVSWYEKFTFDKNITTKFSIGLNNLGK